jgi:ABC-type transport system involved in cytochrome c biogenesis ATPase subunit
MATVALPSRVGWSDFLDAFDWQQGDHVTLLGHTGSGKTTLARHLIQKRQHKLVFATKPRDPNIELFKKDGFYLTRSWPVDSRIKQNVLFWPKIEKPDDVALQAQAIARCLHSVYRTGGWCLYFDEVRYVTDTLGLQKALALIWLQGRSLKLSVLAGTQRPAWIPREAYSEATHLFLWRSPNRYDLKRLEDASNVDTKELAPILQNLPKHDVLHINTRDGSMTRTRVA